MQEMYTMSIEIHFYGVTFLILVILANAILLKTGSDISLYATKMRRLMPISTSLLFLTLFTGTVMMAAKHLEFNFENIVMAVFATIFIGLEIFRYKKLKATPRDALQVYKILAYKLLAVELVGTVLITLWMVV